MARNFGFGKHNRRAPVDDLLMPIGPVWAVSITVIVIILGATFLP